MAMGQALVSKTALSKHKNETHLKGSSCDGTISQRGRSVEQMSNVSY